jgi:type III restriction enzyme
MVRTPLARRIESDAALNDVHLFLPRYNRKAVDEVISDLKNVEDVPPSETGTSRELVTLHRRPGTEEIFSSMASLITYRVNAVRKQSGRRLMGLGRRLAHDEIDEGVQNDVKGLIIAKMNREIKGLRDSGILEERSKNITGVALKTISVQHVTGISEEMAEYAVEAVSADIDRRFQQAGRLLGNGLHMEYWKTHADRDADAVKVEAIVLSEDHDSMRSLEEVAEVAFNEIYENHKRELSRLPERKRTQYDALRLAASIPQAIEWRLPDAIDFKRHPKSPIFEQHLVEDDGKFRVELGTWETSSE